ncbi:hypothetical protein [Maribacter arcticus]|uniref:hypothetical protein n=1 Tax=Maribacter arcticus TaxID=561365 RepID=UPI003001C2A9
MRNWIRKILGIDTIDKTINEGNSATQTKLEKIFKLLESNSDTNSKLENISKLLETNKKEITTPIIEPISEILLSNKSGSIDFKLDNNFKIDENWALLNSTNKTENFFSQASGASTIAASTAYSTSGLYTATASANSLMTYGNGTLSSITMNGSKFGQHAGFVSANAAVFTPLLAFQFASMLTGQYYFKGLSKQLTSIHESINKLISLHHNERLAKLRYINFKISELNKRSYFTTEDYITIDKLKYDLSTIRFEYLLTAEQEINNSLDKVNYMQNVKTIDVISEDTNTLERMKISVKEQATTLLSIISDKFNSLYQDSVLEKGMGSVRKLTENSSKIATKLTNEIVESKYFFYSDVSLKAEHLYQLSKLLELKMNLSDKEPNSNRIGKIKELYGSISTFNMEDSIFDEIALLNTQLETKLVTDIDILKENSIMNKNKIIADGQKIRNELEKSNDMVSRKHILFRDIQEIKAGFEKPNQILIDNRKGRTEIYAKKTIANGL